MKIVINGYFGDFGLSKKALEEYNRMAGGKDLADWEISRNDEILVSVVEKLGKEADCEYSELKVVEIPDDVDWEISDHEGMETIKEKCRSWR